MAIIEIILTIVAWNKGWRWQSLIPIGTVFILGFMMGIGGAESTSVIWLDVMAVIALIIMIFNKKQINENVEINEKEEIKKD